MIFNKAIKCDHFKRLILQIIAAKTLSSKNCKGTEKNEYTVISLVV